MLAGFCVFYALVAFVKALTLTVSQPVTIGQPFNVDWSLSDSDKAGFALYLADDSNSSLHPLTTVNPQDKEGTTPITLSDSDISTIPGRYRILGFDSNFPGTPEYGSSDKGSSSDFPVAVAAQSSTKLQSTQQTTQAVSTSQPTSASQSGSSQNRNSPNSPSTSADSTSATNTTTTTAASSQSGLTSSVGTSDSLSHRQGGSSEASSLSSQTSDAQADHLTTTLSSGTETGFSMTGPAAVSPSSANIVGSSTKSRTPVIIGALFGALLALVLLIALFFLVRRIRQRRKHNTITFFRERMVRNDIPPRPSEDSGDQRADDDFPEKSPLSASVYSQELDRRFEEA